MILIINSNNHHLKKITMAMTTTITIKITITIIMILILISNTVKIVVNKRRRVSYSIILNLIIHSKLTIKLIKTKKSVIRIVNRSSIEQFNSMNY